MNFLFTTEMVLSEKLIIKGIKMVIRNYAITPRSGIEQSAQGIAMDNRRCRLRPIRAKTSLGNLCPSMANVALPSTQGEALGWAFVDISGHFLDLCGQLYFFLLGSFFFFPRPAPSFPVFVAIRSRQAHSAHRSVCEETANRIRSSCGTLDFR